MPSLIQTAEVRPGVVSLRFPFNKPLSDAIKTVPGVRWDATAKQWLCPPHALPGVARAAHPLASVLPPREGIALPSGIVPPLLPRAADLRDYQLEGVRRLLTHRRYLLSFDLRTGKTPTASIAMGSALAAGFIKTLLITYPSTVTGEWRRQFPQWTGLQVGCLEGTKGVSELAKGLTVDAIAAVPYLVLGISFELLRTDGAKPTQTMLDLIEILKRRGTYGLVIDELHYVKNVKAPRTKLMRQLAHDSNCLYVAGLTGTPMRNFPGDLSAPLDIVYPNQFGSYSKFTARYANGHMGDYGWVVEGTSNEEELAERLKLVSMRVTRADAKAYLPKSERRTVLCAMSKEQKEKYERLEGAVAAEVVKALNGAGRDDALKSLAATTTAAKMPVLVERVKFHAVERGVKVLVGAVFHEGLESAWKAVEDAKLGVPMFLAGGWVLPEKRRAMVEAWRAAPPGAVLFVNMLSSGVGIDLSDADVSIGVSLSWVPADFLQFEGRIQDLHLGKRSTPPLYEYLLTKGTIDEDMGKRLLKKLAAAEAIIGADAESAGAREALRESGVVDRNMLSLGTTDPEIVQSVIDRMRAKLMGETVAEVADTDENRDLLDEDEDDDEEEEENDNE